MLQFLALTGVMTQPLKQEKVPQDKVNHLTHLPLVPHIYACIRESGQHWFR